MAHWLRDRGFDAYAVRGGVLGLLGKAEPHASEAPERRSPWRGAVAALRHKLFRRYFAGVLLSLTGSWIEAGAFGYVVLLLGGSAATLGLIGFLNTIPNLAFALPAGVLADIMILGSVPQGRAVLRTGAKPGDHLYVTGELGAPVAMLERMMQKPKGRFKTNDSPAHFHPQPQIRIGRYLRDKRIASAMIDISDGFSTDLTHLCVESGVRAEVQAEAIPIASLGKHEVSLENALHGGDEYQLLFTAPANKRVPSEIGGVPISHIGYIEAIRKDLPKVLVFEGNDAEFGYELHPKGWEHFREAKPRSRK